MCLKLLGEMGNARTHVTARGRSMILPFSITCILICPLYDLETQSEFYVIFLIRV